MVTIKLFCNEGMSTSLLVQKMKDAAAKEGVDAEIAAYPINELEQQIKGIDCALLGPQVGYLKGKSAKICEAQNVPMDVIPMMDYGMCNGANVLAFALKLAGK